MDQFLIELGKSGPWALVAGFLLWHLIKAWVEDRKQAQEFQVLAVQMKDSFNNLAGELRSLVQLVTEHIIEGKPNSTRH